MNYTKDNRYPEQEKFFVESKKQKPYKLMNMYENDIVIIKPTFDASDKEIFKRNGMMGPSEKIQHLVHAQARMNA